jgi:endonuclease/exonuclease/phosphatase family metal-dependent hydrolase
VGPAVVDSSASGSFGEWGPGDSLAVVIWNVNAGGGDLLRFIDSELSLACEAGGLLKGPHFTHFVLMIQEARRWSDDVPDVPAEAIVPWRVAPDPWPGEFTDIAEIARRCGLALVYVPSMRNGPDETEGKREDRGNAILSTLPLSDFVAIDLPFEGSRRVAVAATVRSADGDRLRVANLHFSVSSSLFRVFMTGNATRLREALGLVEALGILEESRGQAESIATTLGGDVNTYSAQETALRALWKSFPESPEWDGKPTRGTFPTDHVFVRQGLMSRIELVEGSYRRIDDSYFSDHHGRIIWLRIVE